MTTVQAQPPEPCYLLPVGDPRRQAVRRAVFGTLLVAAVFLVFAVPTKQFKPLYDHAPWANDPFDTVYSFAMFFVPLLAACLLVQLSLCLKAEPVAISRVLSILRACRVAVGAIVVTLLSCWTSVAVEANRSQWTGGATVLLVALLVLMTGITGKVIVDLLRVPKLRMPEHSEPAASADWLGDIVAVAERESRWFGPLRPRLLSIVSLVDQRHVSRLRRHPLVGAAITSLLFGAAVGVNQGIREGSLLSSTLLTIGVLSCGMFAFLVAAGSYLPIVRSGTPLFGLPRRALDAGVLACIAGVLSLAFRSSLWWLVGTNEAAAGASQLAVLLGITMLATFVVVLGTESMLRSHQPAA